MTGIPSDKMFSDEIEKFNIDKILSEKFWVKNQYHLYPPLKDLGPLSLPTNSIIIYFFWATGKHNSQKYCRIFI